jgi:hypothetical protein
MRPGWAAAVSTAVCPPSDWPTRTGPQRQLVEDGDDVSDVGVAGDVLRVGDQPCDGAREGTPTMSSTVTSGISACLSFAVAVVASNIVSTAPGVQAIAVARVFL